MTVPEEIQTPNQKVKMDEAVYWQSRRPRYLGCDICVHGEHMHDGNYHCPEKDAWIWPWVADVKGVDVKGVLPECSDYQSSEQTHQKVIK